MDCSDIQLSSLYLNCNLNLTQLDCSDNQLSVTLDENNCIDIAILPGFDPDRASNWEGGQMKAPVCNSRKTKCPTPMNPNRSLGFGQIARFCPHPVSRYASTWPATPSARREACCMT